MYSLSKISATIVCIFAILSLASVQLNIVHAQPGTLLRGFDAPKTIPHCCKQQVGAVYWPIGVALAGTNIYYSQPGITRTDDIFLTTTSGTLLNVLSSINSAGALAFDGTNLWVGVFGFNPCASTITGCSLVFEVNPTTGAVLKTLDLSAIFAADQLGGCNAIDGLDFDSSTGTLWVSPDIGCNFIFTQNDCSIGFAYNVDTNGNLLHRVQFSFGVAGIAQVGRSLYTVTCGLAPGPHTIVKTSLEGEVQASFPMVSVSGHSESAEDLAFDAVTFAPNCALWAIQDYGFDPFQASLAAYQIPCP